jgi:hypothetical protein
MEKPILDSLDSMEGLENPEVKEELENSEIKLSFEWGPELGRMSWNDTQEKIAELNETLGEGERPWRLPTKEEWLEVVKPLAAVTEKIDKKKGWSKIDEERSENAIKRIIRENNLKTNNSYWSSTDVPDDSTKVWYLETHDLSFRKADKNVGLNLVRCVR